MSQSVPGRAAGRCMAWSPRIAWRATTFWNFMQAEAKRKNAHRLGELLYRKRNAEGPVQAAHGMRWTPFHRSSGSVPDRFLASAELGA